MKSYGKVVLAGAQLTAASSAGSARTSLEGRGQSVAWQRGGWLVLYCDDNLAAEAMWMNTNAW